MKQQQIVVPTDNFIPGPGYEKDGQPSTLPQGKTHQIVNQGDMEWSEWLFYSAGQKFCTFK